MDGLSLLFRHTLSLHDLRETMYKRTALPGGGGGELEGRVTIMSQFLMYQQWMVDEESGREGTVARYRNPPVPLYARVSQGLDSRDRYGDCGCGSTVTTFISFLTFSAAASLITRLAPKKSKPTVRLPHT